MAFKQVFIINSDLGMRKGKIAVQVAHAEVYYMQRVCDHGHSSDDVVYDHFLKWWSGENNLPTGQLPYMEADQVPLMKKIVLKATELELTQMMWKLRGTVWAYPVVDRGLTQVPKDSFTCLVIEPLPEEECDKLFCHLKLL